MNDQDIFQARAYETLLNRFSRVNFVFSEFLNNYHLGDFNARDLVIASLLEMMRGTSLSMENLLRMKCLKDSQILMRTQIDRFIKLKKNCDDPDFAGVYINSSQQNRLKFIEIAVKNTLEAKNNPLYESFKKAVTEEDFKRLKKEVEQNKAEASLWELASQAGLLHEYYLPYRLYSDPVHAASSELDDCFVKHGDCVILINYGSNKNADLFPTLSFSIHVMIEAMSIVSQFKKIEMTEQLDKLRNNQ